MGGRFWSLLWFLYRNLARPSLADGCEMAAEFDDFLDAYFNSADLYPVSDRSRFVRNDAYALSRDFAKLRLDGFRAEAALHRRLKPESEPQTELKRHQRAVRKILKQAAERRLARSNAR
jgi:hypothetical protein